MSDKLAQLAAGQMTTSNATVGQLNAAQLQATVSANGMIQGLGLGTGISTPIYKPGANPFSEAVRQHEQSQENYRMIQMQLEQEARNAERQTKTAGLAVYKEMYIKIRCDNIALSHENAIELVKMIRDEAGMLSYEDFQ